MQSALTFSDVSQIPFDSLVRFSKAELKSISTWSDVTNLNAKIRERLVPFKITHFSQISSATSVAIDRAIAHHASGQAFYFGNAETVLHPKGASITYAKESLTVAIPNLPPVVYDTTSGYPVKAPRPYLTGILALVSSTFHILSGELRYAFEPKLFVKCFPPNLAAFDPIDLKFVKTSLIEIMKGDSQYKVLVSEGKSLKGTQFWDYMSHLLNECPRDSYIAFHDTVCKRFLQTIVVEQNTKKTGGAFVLGARKVRKSQDEKDLQKMVNIIPDTCVKIWPSPDVLPPDWAQSVRDVEKAFGHRPFALVGSIPTDHSWVAPTGPDGIHVEKDAYESYSTRRGLSAGASNGSGAVLSCNGFSSVASSTSNRCVMLMNLILNALSSGRDLVDVKCNQNDLAYLEAGLPLVCKDHHKHVRYLIDYSKQHSVEVKLREFTITKPREGAHFVAWIDDEVVNVPKGTEVVTALNKQWDDLVSIFPSDSSIMLPIVSSRAFDVSEDDLKGNYRRVYKFRGPADFQGIYSSLPQMFKVLDVDKNVREEMLRVREWADWLREVTVTNSKYATWFLTPRPFFSPMSNLIRAIAKGSSMKYSDGQWEAKFYPDPVFTDHSYDAGPARAPYAEKRSKKEKKEHNHVHSKQKFQEKQTPGAGVPQKKEFKQSPPSTPPAPDPTAGTTTQPQPVGSIQKEKPEDPYDEFFDEGSKVEFQEAGSAGFGL